MKTLQKLFLTLISFSLFALHPSLDLEAQIYTQTAHRGHIIQNLQSGDRCAGGTYQNAVFFTSIKVSSRGQELMNNTTIASSFTLDGVEGDNNAGILCMDYADKSGDVFTVMAGQEFTIETIVGGHSGWTNATLFVDWDGNGSFDDHAPYLYNLYGDSNCADEEWAGLGGNDPIKGIKPKWTIKVPDSFTQKTLVRVRIRADESVDGAWILRNNIFGFYNISACLEGACHNLNNPANYGHAYQYFFSMYLNCFTPTGQFYKGTTVDLGLKIVPDPFAPVAPLAKQTVVGVGNVLSCQEVASGTAITNEAQFKSFLDATSGNYYLANDITISGMVVSDTPFNGTFNGNGHTITFTTNRTVNLTGTTTDECFYPYGIDMASLRTNLMSKNQTTGVVDQTNYPSKAIAGGFCSKLEKGGVIKNVKVVYDANYNYRTTTSSSILFGLIAGINKGHIENVSVDIAATRQVKISCSSTGYVRNPSAIGGITAILYRGVIKNCAVNIDGGVALEDNAGTSFVGHNSVMGGLIGRLQAGIVSNVKFSGSGSLFMRVPDTSSRRNCIGGIAGMTYTPQGIYANSGYDYSWGYDNGTTGLDVNNVILSYSGSMGVQKTAGVAVYHNICRGLLFGEASDTVTVPNLITQYASRPTIKALCVDVLTLTGLNIPLISQYKGSVNSVLASTARNVGELYLYRDGRRAANSADKAKFMNVTTPNTRLDFAYEVDPTHCTSYARPYIVATNTAGTATNISSPSGSNVTFEGADAKGTNYVKITTTPGANVSWTWTTTPYVPPVPPATTFDCSNPTVRNGYCDLSQKVTTSRPIANETDLNALVGTSFDAHLTADFTATAFSRGSFNGKLYGNGHTITFTNVSASPVGGTTVYNLCGGVFSNGSGSIQDLNIKYNWTGTKSITISGGGDRVAGLVMGATSGTILNCSVEVTTGTTLQVSAGLGGVGIAGVLGTSAGGGLLKNITVINNGELIANGGWPWAAGFVATTTPTGLTGENLIFRGNGILRGTSANPSRLVGLAILNGGTSTITGFIYDFRGQMLSSGTQQHAKVYSVDAADSYGGKLNISKYYIMSNLRSALPNDAYKQGVTSALPSKFIYDDNVVVDPANPLTTGILNTPIKAYLKDGVLTLASCTATGLSNYQTAATINDGTTVLAVGESDPLNDKIAASATAPATPTVSSVGIYLVTPVFPQVTIRVGEEGGGKVSLDMGRTTSFKYDISVYDSRNGLMTAVPNGPASFEGWYISTDGGVTFTSVPLPEGKHIDYTYTGLQNAIIEARFSFADYAGNFGTYKFDHNATSPSTGCFYISSVQTENAMVNIPLTTGFTAAQLQLGSPRYKYLQETVSVRHKNFATNDLTVKVTTQNMHLLPADVRLLCFVDTNQNRYFDFTSDPAALTKNLTPNKELFYVGSSNGSATQTHTFTISKDFAKEYGITRMRFFLGTKVDMYGLGPVNQYNNLAFRYDTNSDVISDGSLIMNDSKGKLSTPNNQVDLQNLVNVLDVNVEVVCYIQADEEWIISAGEMVRVKDLYIESKETDAGPKSGVIRFDVGSPVGALYVVGQIVVRKQIYDDKWHHISFPVDMQGASDTETYTDMEGLTKTVDYKGIRVINVTTSETNQLANTTANWVTRTFNSQLRDNTGYGSSANAVVPKFNHNTFYYFAAENPFPSNSNYNQTDGGGNWSWMQFYSVKKGYKISPVNAATVTLPYVRRQSSTKYWDRNVNTIFNPYFSCLKVGEITSNLGWENISLWDAKNNRYIAISAGDMTKQIYPHIGFWIQMTEGIGTTNTGDLVTINLGVGSNFAGVDKDRITFKSQARKVDVPDAYTVGIRTEGGEETITSSVITLTEEGGADVYIAGYDMPMSYAKASSRIPELWSMKSTSRMMFNNVKRAAEVVVPMGIRIKEAGRYTVTLDHTNQAESFVQLYDKVTQLSTDLFKDGGYSSYSFDSEGGDFERFELRIFNSTKVVSKVVTPMITREVKIFAMNGSLRLRNLPEGSFVRICDVLGRELSKTVIFEEDTTLPLPLGYSVYLVNILDKEGSSLQTLKVVN